MAAGPRERFGRQIKRRLLEVERVSHNSGLSGDSIQRVVQPAVTDGKKAPGLKFGQPRVMALLLALTLFQHLIDGFRNRDLRQHVADLLGVPLASSFTNGVNTVGLEIRDENVVNSIARKRPTQRAREEDRTGQTGQCAPATLAIMAP